MALTDSWLKANYNKARDKTVEKADGEGLSVRASPTGKLVFQMRYRVSGKAVRVDLGTYPRMSLKDARNEHQRLKGKQEQGESPKQVKLLEAHGVQGALTNEELYRQWHDAYCVHTKQKADDYLRSFEIHVFPVLGALPADKTTTGMWMTMVEAVTKSAPSIAVRILNTSKQMHKWAGRRGLMVTSPLGDFGSADLLIEKKESGRSLSDAEICLFWHSVERSRMTASTRLFMKLCLFFGCRNGELRSVNPKEDLDFDLMLWTIPKEKNKTGKKTGKAIVRPLIPEVVPMLKEAIALSRSPTCLFTQDAKPVPLESNAVLSMPYSVMKNARRHFDIEMAHWSMHDLRKTARTNFSTLTSVHIAEVMLGHSLKGMQGVYDRHLYIEEQTAAYQAWWQRLQEVVSDLPGR